MLISTLDEVEFAPEYPDLVGRRVLVTGVTGPVGVDVVRAFAEAGTRLVVQAQDDGPDTRALAEIIAPSAMDVVLFPDAPEGSEAMLRFARDAAQRFGGLDCVVNLATVPEPPKDATEAEIEALVAKTLAMAVATTRVAANRMRTMLASGAILTILVAPRDASPAAQLLARIARAALASFTRTEAQAAADAHIRINAIVPAAAASGAERVLSGAADVATMALHLASGQGHELTGLVFEAWCG